MILSIIIPVYKVEKYIRKCLDSIFSQQYDKSKVEIIVVNDGTPDNSMLIVQEFADSYDNIRILNQDNQGLSAARNAGIEVAQGDYVWFVDSDDWLEPNSLNTMIKRIAQYLGDVFMIKLRHYNENGQILEGWTDKFISVEVLKGYEFISKKYPFAPIQELVISRRLLERYSLRFVRGIYHEDHEFAPRLLMKTKMVVIIPEYLYDYLIRDSGSITSDNSLRIKRKESIMWIIIDQIKHLHSTDKYEREIYNYLITQNLKWFWNDLSMSEWKYWKKDSHFLPIWHQLKLIVFNSYMEHSSFKFKMIITLFFISPTTYKYIGKVI